MAKNLNILPEYTVEAQMPLTVSRDKRYNYELQRAKYLHDTYDNVKLYNNYADGGEISFVENKLRPITDYSLIKPSSVPEGITINDWKNFANDTNDYTRWRWATPGVEYEPWNQPSQNRLPLYEVIARYLYYPWNSGNIGSTERQKERWRKQVIKNWDNVKKMRIFDHSNMGYSNGGPVYKNHKKLLPELSTIEYKSKDDNEYANKLYRLQTIKNLYDNDELTDDEYLQMVDDNLKSADGYKNAGKIGSYIQGYTGDESVSDYINNQLRKSSIGNMIADGRWTKDWEYNMLGR